MGGGCKVKWEALAIHWAAGDLRRNETCLDGIQELRGGERLECGAGRVRTGNLWSPWEQASPDRQFAELEEAIRRLRDTASHSVRTRSPRSAERRVEKEWARRRCTGWDS